MVKLHICELYSSKSTTDSPIEKTKLVQDKLICQSKAPGRQELLQPSASSQHPECLKFSARGKNTAPNFKLNGQFVLWFRLKTPEDTHLEELIEIRYL